MSSGNVMTELRSLAPDERKQLMELFVAHLAVTGSVERAATAVGVNGPTARYWISKPGFQNSLFSERSRAIQNGAGLALKVLMEVMQEPSTPAAVRVTAATKLLGLAGHAEATAAADAAGGSGPAALHELTEDQLARHIAAAGATLAALRSQPMVLDVVPDVVPDEDALASLL